VRERQRERRRARERARKKRESESERESDRKREGEYIYRYRARKFNMGWLRLVGSIKLKVAFAEYRLFYRALWQKRPVILSTILTAATP